MFSTLFCELFACSIKIKIVFFKLSSEASRMLKFGKGLSQGCKSLNPVPNKPWVRIHQPFSRMFFVFFSKICEVECNTTYDWLNLWFSQSEVVLHSNASKK